MADEKIAARNRRNKRAGAAFETALESWFRDQGFEIDRLRLKGSEDEGDLVIREDDGRRLVIEAKSGAFTPGPFISEAEVERVNYAKHRGMDGDLVDSVVIVKRRGKGVAEAYVLTTVRDYFGLES